MSALRRWASYPVWGNALHQWALVAAVVLGVFVLLLAVRAALRGPIKRATAKTRRRLDDLLVELLGEARASFLFAVALLPALPVLRLSPRAGAVVRSVVLLVVLFQFGTWLSRALREWVRARFEKSAERDPTRRSAAAVISVAGRAVLWVIVLLMALDNLGVNISALVAGLGVGGVAVALATQNILGDVFASVSILLDKPFVVGDFVVVGDFLGTVERIGIKTTRVRSLTGEQIVFANNDLLQSRLRNYRDMAQRRVVFSVGVVYETPLETLRTVPAMLKSIVEATPGTRFDRAHFKTYADSSLQFEVVYYVTEADFNRAMDVQQAINLEIFGRFESAGISFAYPTQTLLLQPAPGVPRLDSLAAGHERASGPRPSNA